MLHIIGAVGLASVVFWALLSVTFSQSFGEKMWMRKVDYLMWIILVVAGCFFLT